VTSATAASVPASPPQRPEPPRDSVATDRPQRAAGLELVGRFEGSGFSEPFYLARRSDGQVIQLSRLLHLVADAADGGRDPDEIAARVSTRFGRGVSADNVRYLIDHKLRPLGVLAAADGSTPELPKRPPLLALRHRRPLVPARVVRGLALAFTPLFLPPVIAIVLAALVAFDTWLFGFHGVADGFRAALYDPTLLLGLLVCVIAATAFHEVGHAAACRYGGARPGAIGAGLYIVWPAFYCDVTDAYCLDRRGRLRTDLGGIYFNGISSLLAGAAYFATGQEAVLLLVLVQHLTMFQQLLPLMRFDGYYVISDLTGVPDILSRIGPILRSLAPFRRTHPRVRELKAWVRLVVTLYVALLVPVLLLLLTWMVMGAPRVFATAFDSLALHADRVAAAFAEHDWSVAALSSFQVLALLLQCAGICLVLGRTARSGSRRLRAWSKGSATRTVVALAVRVGVAAAVVALWWPNGEYQPLRPGERGTIPEGLSGVPELPNGRPAFTPQRESRFVWLPTLRQLESPARMGGLAGGDSPATSRGPSATRGPPAATDEALPRPTRLTAPSHPSPARSRRADQAPRAPSRRRLPPRRRTLRRPPRRRKARPATTTARWP
jgi:putative peptide zinc metalloprotease protein